MLNESTGYIISLLINAVTIITGIIGFISLSKKLPGELESQRIKNAKERSDALEQINDDAEKAFMESSEYRRKFLVALEEIEVLKGQIKEISNLKARVAFLECEQENYKNENKAYMEAYENTCSQIRKHGEEPYPVPYIRRKDCSELVKGNGHVE